ncbi:Gfo/Idh/MocA family oxidoreductase [Komagataeibacter rhaeticus]|nr:Gfo/Idh/MocA family oxidoreductase [Komagataeibacter rhaeticus]
MLGIGVLGCGRIGAMHATNIAAHPRARVAAVYDINPDAARAVSLATGAPVMASAAGVLAAPDVDAVLIATATDTHADLLEQAIAAGKPVLCENRSTSAWNGWTAVPPPLRARPCRCRSASCGVSTPATGRCARRCAMAGWSTLYQVIITSRDPGLPPAAYLARSGGILRDMTIHDFDMARFILDEEPTEVFATGSRLVAPALMETLGIMTR